MRAYVCFDDTDTIDCGRGTGKLARWFEEELPEGCTLWGVVRQQLPVDPAIPFTSHNSSACAVVDAPDRGVADHLIERGAAHIAKHFIEGSDPGLCVVFEDDPALAALMAFGRLAATTVVTQREAMDAARGAHLSGHGGTDDGIIGAAAGVGLTAGGWSGRFIEYGLPSRRLRDFPRQVAVGDLGAAGVLVLSLDKDGGMPHPDDLVDSDGWLRPRLWGGKATLPVRSHGEGMWRGAIDRRKRPQ